MRVRVRDIHLFFDVEGLQFVPDGPRMREKPTLLLLHGAPGFDHSFLKPAFSAFREQFHVIYLDHRGCGRSDRGPADRWRIDQWADDVYNFCEALDIKHPFVLGVSFGGIVAQAYAIRYPDHPRALVLCSTAARHRPDRAIAAFERLGGAEAGQLAAAWFENPCKETGDEFLRVCGPLYKKTPWDSDMVARLEVYGEIAYAFAKGEWRTFNFLPTLSQVRCPTLVLSGEDDPITPIEDGEELATALPPEVVQFKRFPKCGHPVYEDDEAGCFAAVRDFLATVEADGQG